VNKLKSINPQKMGKERTKREYDLRVLNLVGESEYASRMAVWNNLSFANDAMDEVKDFIDNAFNKLQAELKGARSELSIDYNEFVTTATEEVNYIRGNVADSTTQYFWYVAIALMVAGTVAICI
jgi:hypothetical protein